MNQKTKNLYKIMQSRTSIRKYKSQKIEKEKLNRVLHAGFHAPSGKNQQNWIYFILEDEILIDYLQYTRSAWNYVSENLKKKLKPNLYELTKSFFYNLGGAPHVILAYAQIEPNENEISYIGSVFMSLENIILAATAEGLGACPMGAITNLAPEIDSFLNLQSYRKNEKKLKLVSSLVIGYPDHCPIIAPKKIENKLFFLNNKDSTNL